MRLVRYRHGATVAAGVRVGDEVVPTPFGDVLGLLRAGEAGRRVMREVAGRRADAVPLAAVQLLSPMARPPKIVCCGINYASHQEENPAAVLPTEPFFFAKLPTAVIGPGEPIVLPSAESQVDYEVELAFVIGSTARRVARASALSHVFGYTVLNDVSARDVQFKDQQITLGKGFDTFCPLGPEIVLADEIPDPAALRVRSYVNGALRQDSPTLAMLFDVPTLLEHLTRHVTLEPGDVISTGTPAGCGTFRNPPLWLKPGDIVEVEVDAIGRLANPVVAGW